MNSHISSNRHKKNVQGCSSSQKIDQLFTSSQSTSLLTNRVSAAEGALAFHTVRHHSSYRSMDCTPQLNQTIYPDSEVARKVSSARTKTECIINKVIAPHAIDITIECLRGISCFGVSTDASNHGHMKIFPLLIQYFDYKVGGIKTKLVELKTAPNETSEHIAGYIRDTLTDLGIVNKCVAFAGDNTNTNFGGINRREGKNIFSKLRACVNSNMVGIGCPAHILNNTVQHGADIFSVDIECFILKVYNYFSIYTVRNEDLKSYCEFVDTNYKQLLSHSKTRWLSLFPAIERVLEMFAPLRSYFLSVPNPPKLLITFFENGLSEAYLWHLHSLMTIFHSKILEIEKEESSVLEIVNALQNVRSMLQKRFEGSFMSRKVKEIIENVRKQGFDKEADVFLGEAMMLYKVCSEYLEKWIMPFDDFNCFLWMDLKKIEYADVEKSIVYLQTKGINVDDVKCFDQFCNLQQFIECNNDAEFHKLTSSQKWAKYFNASADNECHSELLKIAEFFFSIPGHNANVERVFSLISSQWTDERNRLSIQSVKGLLLVQYNFKEYSCQEFYKYLLSKPKLLEGISSSGKYL